MAEPALRLRVRDTLTEKKVRLAPRTTRGKPTLTLYVCGVTPYDSGHMGHAFTFSMFDVLVRFIESGGVRVRYAQNVTDIDDPLFERARRDGEDWRMLARHGRPFPRPGTSGLSGGVNRPGGGGIIGIENAGLHACARHDSRSLVGARQ